MYRDIDTGNGVLKGEKAEQMVEEIINTLAHHELNYDTSKYILNLTIEEIGRRYFFKV